MSDVSAQVSPAAMRPITAGILSFILLALPTATFATDAPATSDDVDFFETEIRPVLATRCLECHGPKKQWAGLRLDTREAILKGGDSGPAIVPGRPDDSELLRRLAEADESLRMPPEDAGERLTPRAIEAFARWVKSGAAWPDSAARPDRESTEASRDHWAFQPVRKPPIPTPWRADWCETSIDRFILQALESKGLGPSPPADRRTLIRRVTYDLTGLPPTSEEVDDFVRDDAPDAYSRLVDRLLASPRYGEHQARHWLDVARYSDTKGYVYAREERFFVHSSHYRDWVIKAFNTDLSYDRFVLLQLAADQVETNDPSARAAMGFLTLGRRFLGVTPDIIDDRIDVTCRGLMGLTVGCARCHDHKYDPIPTADYYSLYGVFQNSAERLIPLPTDGRSTSDEPGDLQERTRKLAETLATRRGEAADRVRGRITDYLLAQRELDKYPVQGFDQIIARDDLIPAFVRRWDSFLRAKAEAIDPVFAPWRAFVEIPDGEFSDRTAEVTAQLTMPSLNPRVAEAFAQPPGSFRDVAERYGRLFGETDHAWRMLCETATRDGVATPTALPDPADEELRQVLYGARSPCLVPDESIVDIESLFDTATIGELWKLQVDVERALLEPGAAPHAVILKDRQHPANPRIFRRGNAALAGDEVPLRFLEAIAGADRPAFAHGSGRLELAEAIIDPKNPLTARVWINRVWMHHFGEGLVRTPSDFGLRSDPPSHPELLDWLTDVFIADGWNTKALHRRILLSAAYRQRSDGPADTPLRERAAQIDPENRLLWRMNSRRLGYEELRDTWLAVSGELNATLGGRPVESFSTDSPSLRRSIYGLVDRQFVPAVMRTFDFANPDLHTPQRSETTVPQQALFALNHPFAARSARSLASRLDQDAGPSIDARIETLFRLSFQREPADRERAAARSFLQSASDASTEPNRPATTTAWSYGYGESDEQKGTIRQFRPLPHFTGIAWQGGTQWPDAALGWVQLTGQGGHPGNDLNHAAVRRWTAPRSGMITIASTVQHEPTAGDGIRCRIVSSRHGLLASAAVHHETHTFDLAPIEMQAGDTLDFIADIHATLNSDQFLWSHEVKMTGSQRAPSADAVVWNAERDFTGSSATPLGPWDRIAQVLLISNELLFVD